MLWFGKIPLSVRWCRAKPALVGEVARKLVPKAFARAINGGDGGIFLNAASADAWNRTINGRHARLSLSLVPASRIDAAVEWTGDPPDEAASDYVRCMVFPRRGVGLAACAFFAAGRCYRLRELIRALEISFECVALRRELGGVLKSGRLPAPIHRALRHDDLAAPLAVFRCENHSCSSRGAEMLVRMGGFSDAFRQGVHRSGGIAYPCPGCPESWASRWALTWVRPFERGADAGRMAVVEYPVQPTRLRCLPGAGSVMSVTCGPRETRWGSVWDGSAVPGIPPQALRFTRNPRPQELMKAFKASPLAAGALSAHLLTPDNLRAFTDFCRSVPPRQKGRRVATALALAFNPRRMAKYPTEHDKIQAGDGHHHYIALDPGEFFDQLRYYRLLENAGRFLDVGSGIGEKVFLAFALGRFSACDGLEYDPQTLAVAAFLLAAIAPQDAYPIRMFKGDALRFGRYGDYDVIYMYRPFRDGTLMARLVRTIAARMKVGAVMFDALRKNIALMKTGRNRFVAAGTGPDGFVVWDEVITLDDFLWRCYSVPVSTDA